MSSDDADPASTFPVRLGAIDVGSNAMRFVAAEFVSPDRWVELEYQRVPVRLGHNAFLTGELDEEVMAAAVEAMAYFRTVFDNLGLVRYRAVATSAVRESRNGGELVARIRRECGIRLETITGSEEARLVWTAVRQRVEMAPGEDWMFVDLGGGSLEVSRVNADGIEWSESHTMGTVRLLEELGEPEADPARYRRLVAEYAGTLRIAGSSRRDPPAGLVGTGGNIETLAELWGGAPDEAGVREIGLDQLRTGIDRLAELTVAERVETLDLRQDRADVILPAALIYERVAMLAGAERIVVPNVGVKEGLLLDLLEDLTGPSVHASRVEQQVFQGAVALGRRFDFDETHGRHVARLSLSLFDQLRDLHGLGDDERRILLGAAVLHDVGQFVSYRKHHKHSLYLIHNSEVPNFSPEEIPLVALVARYHRRAEPSSSHFLYGDLGKKDRARVRALSAILRLADALDREHQQKVTEVRARTEKGELILEIEGRGDLLLEQWALRKKARLFQSAFDLEVRPLLVEATVGPSVI